MKFDVIHMPQEKRNSCWHASARMIYGYKKAVCTHPLPPQWDKDRGLSADEFVVLAGRLGLKTLPKVNQTFDRPFLEAALKTHGPLWAAGQWNGVNHIVVITGVDGGGKVYVNDPAFPAPVVRDMAWFNDKIDKDVDAPLMYVP